MARDIILNFIVPFPLGFMTFHWKAGLAPAALAWVFVVIFEALDPWRGGQTKSAMQ